MTPNQRDIGWDMVLLLVKGENLWSVIIVENKYKVISVYWSNADHMYPIRWKDAFEHQKKYLKY